MKKYIFFFLCLFVGLSASARTNVYDLRSFYLGDMPIYRATPDRARELLGKPLTREGYLTPGGDTRCILTFRPGGGLGDRLSGFTPRITAARSSWERWS